MADPIDPKVIRLQGEFNALQEESLRISKEQGEASLAALEAQKKAVDAEREYLLTKERTNELTEDEIERLQQLNLTYNIYVEQLKAAQKEQATFNSIKEKGELATQRLFQSLLKTNTGLGTFIDKLQEATKKGGSRGLEAFKKGLMSSGNGLLIFAQVGKKAADMFVQFGLEQDKAIAGFKAATGAGDEFNDTITDSALALGTMGVDLKKSAEATRILKNEFTDFAYLNQAQQNAIAKTTLTLGQLGFSFKTQAEIAQFATQSLGKDIDQTNQLLLDIASTAKSLGIDISEMGAQFSANREFLVRFGKDAQSVFEELAVTAKALGTEISTLTKLTDKFQTFESAATVVGRFNAILNGPFLNAMDLLNASYEDPIAGIEMLRDAFDSAGRSIEDLSGAEMRAFADALGVSNVELTELLGQTNDQLKIQRMDQEAAAKAAQDAQDVMAKLSNSFKQLLVDAKPLIDNVIIPLIDNFGDLVSLIGSASSKLSKFGRIAVSLGGVAALAGLIGGLPAAIGAVGLAAGAGALATIPAFNDGTAPGKTVGTTVGSTVALVGESGPELVNIPNNGAVSDSDTVKKLVESIEMLASRLDGVGGSGQEVVIKLGEETVGRTLIKGTGSREFQRAFSPFQVG